jgi:hypothetical protein
MTVNGMHALYPIRNWPNVPVKSVRFWDCGVTWKDVNPEPGVFNFDRLNNLVSFAENKGVTHITLVLGMTPAWAARNPNTEHFAPWLGPGTNSAPHTMSDWTNYVSAVVKRFKGRIHAYQIWNEPQLKDFWEEDSYAPLGHMTKLAYDEIKKIDKDADVVAAAVLPRPSSGGMKRGSKYLKELRKRKWPVTVMACHAYPEQGKGPGRMNEFIKQFKRTLFLMRCPVKRRWITETNYNVPTGPSIDSDSQIHWLIDKTNEVVDRHGIERLYWYGWGHTHPHMFGLVFDQNTEAANALKKHL